MPKVEELVDRSKGKIRADVAHRKLVAMGYRGSERSTRRAVAKVKEAWQAGRRRRYRRTEALVSPPFPLGQLCRAVLRARAEWCYAGDRVV
jgi:hypothetical protein